MSQVPIVGAPLFNIPNFSPPWPKLPNCLITSLTLWSSWGTSWSPVCATCHSNVQRLHQARHRISTQHRYSTIGVFLCFKELFENNTQQTPVPVLPACKGERKLFGSLLLSQAPSGETETLKTWQASIIEYLHHTDQRWWRSLSNTDWEMLHEKRVRSFPPHSWPKASHRPTAFVFAKLVLHHSSTTEQ